jgi:hypothetical protein
MVVPSVPSAPNFPPGFLAAIGAAAHVPTQWSAARRLPVAHTQNTTTKLNRRYLNSSSFITTGNRKLIAHSGQLKPKPVRSHNSIAPPA